MDLFREWLGPTVEQELGEVLEWRSKSEVNRSQLTGKIGHITFDDDGSNLRIRSAKKPVVQIIKFVPDQEPLQACLSDSVNRVDATIAKGTVERYKRKTGKRLTDGTLGGFIQLLEFEIVATHIGSRQKRITLFVTELKALGANGSGGYGMPRPIEDGPKIKELIQKLIQFRAQESARRQTPSRQQHSNNIVMSQPDTIGSQENSPRHTQTMFATQAPLPKKPADRSPTAKAFSSGSVVDPSKPLLHKSQAHAKPSLSEAKRTLTDGEALLSLLQRSKKQLPNANAASEDPTRSHLANRSTTHAEHGAFAVQVDSMRPPPVAASEIVDNPAQSPIPASLPAASEDTTGGHVTGTATQVDQPMQNKGETMTSFPKRICSRDVRITKDQEKLLNSVDSWLPAEPGKRGPVANLPISILYSLNQKADLQARRRGTFPKNRNLSRDPEKSQEIRRTSSFDNEDSSLPGSDSDAPVPDNEWPPSPARDQLPPDSSAENISVQTTHIRRSSNASSLSRLTQSKQPTPLVTRSSTNSVVQSPFVMSPNIVPNPARPRSQQQSRSITPKSSASRTSAPVSVGATSAVPHSMEERTFADHHEFVEGDESVGKVRAAREDTMPAILPQRSPGVSEILSELKPRHGNHLGRSPEVNMKIPLVHGDPFQDGVLSPHRASTPVEPSPLQSSRVHSAPENLNGGRRHKSSSGLYSIPPSPESELEVAAPFSLNDKATFPSKLTHKPFPSTASQPTEPFTQVKQTPYVKGQIQDHSPPRLERHLSFPRSNASNSLANGHPSEDVDHVTQSTPSILEVSSSEAFTDSTKENMGMKIIDKISATMKAIDDMQSHSVQPSGNSEPHGPEILSGGHEYSNESDAIEKPSAAASREEGGKFEVHTQGNRDIHVAHSDTEIKRKASDLGFLSTNVAKRRKKFKIPRAFPVTQNMETLPDPLDAARRYRQNFIISRKCSEAGKPEISRLTPSAVSKTGSPDFIGLRMNPEDQVAPEIMPEMNRQTLVDDKTQASGFQDDEPTKIDLLTKRSAGDESDRMERLAPGNAQPMTPSRSKSSIQGTKIGETETQSKSLPLNGLNELTPGPKMKGAHPAVDNGSLRKKNMHNLRELVSNPDDEDGLKDTVAGAAPYAIPDHDFNDDDAQNTTPIDQSLDVAAKIAGPDSQPNHLMGSEVDDATPGAQAVDVTDLEAKLGRTDESAEQATDFRADDARPSVQSNQVVASDATPRPEIGESMHLDSGSTRSYPTNDRFKGVEAHDLSPGAQHGEAMDNQPDDFTDDIGRLDTAKLTKDEPGPYVNGESLHVSGNRSGSDGPKHQSSLELQESLFPDHSDSISESPNAPESLVPEAGCVGSQPNCHTVSPVQVAPDPLRANLQDSQKYEALAIAMSVQPANAGLDDPPNSPAVVPAPVSNLDAGLQFPESPPEQSALPQILQPDAYVKTAATVIGSTAEHKGPEMPSPPQNIFSRFRAAYPAYSGDLKHFGAVCRKIKTLVGLDRMLHQFLWDDFIIRHKIEYAQHLRQCAEDADDAVPYEDFYKTEIKKPLYCYGLVTPENLDEVLSLLDAKSSVPSKRKINEIATATKATRKARIVDQEPSLAPERSSTCMQKRSKRRETIDLTLDDPEDHSIKSEDTSTVSPMSGTRKVRRSLPWKETNTQTEKPSPQRREPVDVGARLRASKEPSDTPTKLDRKASKNPDATTDGRSIRETWGIGAHDVLESRYYDKISPRHLQLMKDIANVVDLEEARRLIYNTIQSRAGLRQGVSKAVTVADLEAVLQGLLTKNVKKGGSRVKENATKMMADPPGAHQTRASHETRKGEGPGEWWKDENTPFKSFAKAYKSIKPGNGNSFAKEVLVRTEAGASRAVKRDKRTVKKQIDPLSWEL